MTRNSVLRLSDNRSMWSHFGVGQGLLALAVALLGIAAIPPRAALAAPAVDAVRRPAQITAAAKTAPRLGAVPATQKIDLDLTLPLRNKAQLDALIMRQSDPMDSQYKHYLTPEQFAQEFGPTQADYDALTDFARSQGLTVTQTSKSHLLLHVQGTAAQVGTAFGVQLSRYARPDGSAFYAADDGPLLPRGLAARGANVIGLTDFARPTPQFVPASAGAPFTEGVPVSEVVQSQAITPSGPSGFLAPSDVTGYYGSVSTANYNGAGQSVALLELNTYNPADVDQYISEFGVGENTHFYKELVGGYVEPPYDGSASGQEEVTLDVDMVLIFAPQINNVYVYEGGDFLSLESQIADDDRVSAVSISWADQEDPSDPSLPLAESPYFAQMAAEGMSVFAAAGDTGAYNDTGNHVPGNQVVVQDPASQPWVTGVGGTKINSNIIGQLTDEVAWTSGGGGISQIWPLPPYQTVLGATSDSQLSTTMRNVPDLSANAGTGYAVYFNSAWRGVDGTSAAAPLWAGYVARYNQYNAQNGYGPSGNINALLYANYASSFLYNNSILKDITSGDNGVFSADGGYDNVTGLGTMQHDWIVSSSTATVTAVSAPGVGVYGQPLTFPVTVTPYAPIGAVSGTVDFYENTTVIGLGVQFGSSACTDGQGTLTYNALPVGRNYVSAAYAGGGAFSGSVSSAQSVVITPGLASPTFSVSPSTPTVGQPFTVTATVSPAAPSTLTPTGKVQFTDAAGNVLGEYNLSSGIAYVNLTETTAGSFIIKGQYEGNGGYAPIAISPITVVIGRAMTTTALSGSPSTARVGQPVTLTATVAGYGTPSGTVTFTDGSTTLGTATLSGGTASLSATFTSAGSHSIQAAYSGDSANAASSASGTVTVILNNSATRLSLNLSSAHVGQPVTLTATVTGYGTPTGTVTFTDGSTTLGTATLSNGTASLTTTFTTAGSHNPKATYEGDSANATSSAGQSFTVTLNSSATTLAVSTSSPLTGQPDTLTATVTGFGTPSGTVTFTDGSTTLGTATLSGGTASLSATFTSAGSHTIRAVYSGDSANAASSASGTVTVALSTTIAAVVTLQGVASGNLAQPLTITLTPTGVTGGSVTTQTVIPAAADGSFTLTGIPAGTYTLGIKGSKWLRKDVALDTTGGNVTGLSVSLLGGDANGDNQVTALDLLAVKNAYNSVLGDANYNAAADFNCDGQVTALDLLIVKLNYNKTGDQ
jgi:subtilase family serine protease